jgi:hypothetical protein
MRAVWADGYFGPDWPSLMRLYWIRIGKAVRVIVVPRLCEMDGEWEDTYGGEHYWACVTPAIGKFDTEHGDMLLCAVHAEAYMPDEEEDWPPGLSEVVNGS